MKFRNAHFKNLPMSDAVKVTLPEMILNDYTEILIETLGQDVLRMTTVDWIELLLFPIKIILIPFDSYLKRKIIVKHFEKDTAIRFTTYREFRLYWRDFSDFKTKPYRWNET